VLKQTLASIVKGKGIPQQIVVVDQSDSPFEINALAGSVPDTVRLIVEYLKEPSSTAARNKGIQLAKCSIILFMDDDVLLDSNTLISLQKKFVNNSIALVAVPDFAGADKGMRYPTLFGMVFLRKKPLRKAGYICKGAVLGRYPERIKDTVRTQWAMGYFFAVRRKLLEAFQVRFDEKLISYAYGEDLDFSYTFIKQAENEGYTAILDSNIYVNHLACREWRLPTEKAACMQIINRYYLSYKHFKCGLMRLILIWSDFGELLRRFIFKQQPHIVFNTHLKCLYKRRLLKKGIIDNELLNMMK